MAKWDKHSRKWEPDFASRLKQRNEDMLKKTGRKRYIVTKPLSQIATNDLLKWQHDLWIALTREYFPDYKYLTYDEMIELKLRGYEIVLAMCLFL
jgi:hypothetical protein